MRKVLIFSLLPLVVYFVGCATSSVTTSGPQVADVLSQPYNGPRARIAVGRIENRVSGDPMMEFKRRMAILSARLMSQLSRTMRQATGERYPEDSRRWLSLWASYQDPIGAGVKDMLITELVNCNRFLVYERQDLDMVLFEQDINRMNQSLEGVDLIVFGAITEFSAESQGGEISVPLPVLSDQYGNVKYKRAHVAMDLRLVDVRTGRIVSVISVRGSASKIAFGSEDTGSSLPTVFYGYKNTPVAAALRKMVRAAVRELILKIPPDYYRYRQ